MNSPPQHARFANQKVNQEVELAREAVAQMFGSYKVDMTELELNLWRYEIDRLGATAMLAFVRFWVSGGGQAQYPRAPRVDDFKKRMDPDFVSADDALELLRREVRSVGPYSNPTITDIKLQGAILALGGWARVCQDMPDASLDFDNRRFAERFKCAWTQGEADFLQGRVSLNPLLGLVDAPKQLGIEIAVHIQPVINDSIEVSSNCVTPSFNP